MNLFENVKPLVDNSTVKLSDEDLQIVISCVIQAQDAYRLKLIGEAADA